MASAGGVVKEQHPRRLENGRQPHGGFIRTHDENPWLFTDEEVYDTPSRISGIPIEAEQHILAMTATFLQDCTRELVLPQLTTSVAMQFFQRFFMLESMSDHKPAAVAAACLFLACKVQETHKRLHHVIVFTVKVRTRNTADYPDGLDIQEDSPEYYEEKRTILDKEREVLKVLNFDLTIDHSYKHLWTLHKCFVSTSSAGESNNEDEAGYKRRAVTQSAWNFLNDSFRSYIPMAYDPREIATAALFLAAKLHRFELPDGTGTCPRTQKRLIGWSEYFYTDRDRIMQLSERILDLYSANDENG